MAFQNRNLERRLDERQRYPTLFYEKGLICELMAEGAIAFPPYELENGNTFVAAKLFCTRCLRH